ncbi:heme-binding protein [Mycobacterium sp. 050128]
MIGQVLDAAGAVFGYRHGTEEPDHSAEKLTPDVEIRRYGARIAAETTVTADEETARNAGFRRLARYIFGANRDRQQIAMTAPVAQHAGKGEKIAMTAPVAQERAGDGQWVIRFFMPSDRTLESLPVPDDAEVRLVSVPPETIAVRRFSGSRSARAVAAQTAELFNTLRDNGFKAIDAPEAWFYDPPWTVPPLRRNEIAVPVELAG